MPVPMEHIVLGINKQYDQQFNFVKKNSHAVYAVLRNLIKDYVKFKIRLCKLVSNEIPVIATF